MQIALVDYYIFFQLQLALHKTWLDFQNQNLLCSIL